MSTTYFHDTVKYLLSLQRHACSEAADADILDARIELALAYYYRSAGFWDLPKHASLLP